MFFPVILFRCDFPWFFPGPEALQPRLLPGPAAALSTQVAQVAPTLCVVLPVIRKNVEPCGEGDGFVSEMCPKKASVAGSIKKGCKKNRKKTRLGYSKLNFDDVQKWFAVRKYARERERERERERRSDRCLLSPFVD